MLQNKKKIIVILMVLTTSLNSQAEDLNLQKIGLTPGSKFKIVKHKLHKQGWAQEGKLACGEGYNAVCGVRFTKQKKNLTVYTNANKDHVLLSIEEDF